MEIEVQLSEDEKWETPIGFAEAVINHFMDDGYISLDTRLIRRKQLGEVVEHLKVFCKMHPVSDYDYKEL